MNRRKVAVGPGASSLILIAVVLALSVLTVLTMISARSDEALTRRTLETRQETYGLFAAGEASLARLDAVLAECLKEEPAGGTAYLELAAKRLPDGMRMDGDRVSWTERTENRILECAVRVLESGGKARTEWTLHRLGASDEWEEDEELGDWEEDSGEEAEETEESAEAEEQGGDAE